MSVRELEHKLASGGRPVVLVTGEAGPLVEEEVGALVAWGAERAGLAAFNVSTFRGGEAGALDAVVTARTLPMMSALRVVLVRHVHEGDASLLEALLDYLGDPSPTTLLVLHAGKFPPARKGDKAWGARLQNAAGRVGLVVSLDADAIAPAAFAIRRARALGKRLDERDADLLVALVGNDLGRLAPEVDKVSLFVGDADHIDSDAIHAACSMLAEAVAWDLTAGLAARDPEVSLEALHRLLADGDDPRRLLGLVAWQLRQVLQVAERVRRGDDDRSLQRELKLRGDQVRTIRQGLKRGGLPGAAPVMERLARAYRDMNSHRAGDERVLESLIVDLCRPA